MRWIVLVVGVVMGGCASSTRLDARDVGRDSAGSIDAAVDASDGGTVNPVDASDTRILADRVYALEGCPRVLLRADLEFPPLSEYVVCTRSADCTQAPHGVCRGEQRFGDLTFSQCRYDGCETDTDCSGGETCMCLGSGSRECVRTDCREDSDCPTGRQCLRTEECDRGVRGAFLCTTDEDECHSSADCVDAGYSSLCYFKDNHRVCEQMSCTE